MRHSIARFLIVCTIAFYAVGGTVGHEAAAGYKRPPILICDAGGTNQCFEIPR